MTRLLVATLGVLALTITCFAVAAMLHGRGLPRRAIVYVMSSPVVVAAFCLGWSSIALSRATPSESTWGVIGSARNAFQPNEVWEYAPGGKALERRAFLIPGIVGLAGILISAVLGNVALGRGPGVLRRIALNLYFLLVASIASIWLLASYLHATGFAI